MALQSSTSFSLDSYLGCASVCNHTIRPLCVLCIVVRKQSVVEMLAFPLTLMNTYSVLLLTLDTPPKGHFFNQTQSPWDVNQTAQLLWDQSHLKMVLREHVKKESAHLEHSNVGVVWRRGQVAAAGHWVVGRLHIQLASQDAFIIELLLTHSLKRVDQLQVNFHASWSESSRQTTAEYCQYCHRTDPFADLSVDEGQVVQVQHYLWWPTANSSKAKPNAAISPRKDQKKYFKINI